MKSHVEKKTLYRLVIDLDASDIDQLETELDYLIDLRNGETKAMGLHVVPEIYNQIVEAMD